MRNVKIYFLIRFFVLMQTVSLDALKLGLENFGKTFPVHMVPHGKGGRIGLVANQTSCDQKGKHAVEILRENGFNIVLLFATEHGFNGDKQASVAVDHSVDAASGIPIVSLYGKNENGGRIKVMDKECMDQIDCIVFDLQEAGMRHYTYLDTLLRVIQSAALYDKVLIICDRPNFLGHRIDGPPGNMRMFSKDSVGSLPLRHGMTIGEIARYFNECVVEKKASLYISPLSDYFRDADVKNFFLSKLSPNIVSHNAVCGYSFLGVLGEVRPFDLAIGTPQAFQVICLPDIVEYVRVPWDDLAKILRSYNIASDTYSYFSERKKKKYKGLALQVHDIGRLKSFEALIAVLDFFKKNGVQLSLSSYFDTAVGDVCVRQWLEGKCSMQEVIDYAKKESKKFIEKASDYFLYQPLPYISYMHFTQDYLLVV